MIDYYYDNVFLQPPEPREIPDSFFVDYARDPNNAEELAQVMYSDPILAAQLEYALVQLAYFQTGDCLNALYDIVSQFNAAVEDRVNELVFEKVNKGIEL